ncbi:DUF1273 domain-containing protein [Halalkalibacterium halodurans]|uniref:DUF1273 domain-containing protein n=1 Tax=Halalkalibacterium halodurans TaxID=86665 RepID=UPI002E1D5A1F|nr:DUF1273 domain-containing protein [Halalkalibacterium halodurans]
MKVITLTGYKAHELGIFSHNHRGITYIKKAFEQQILALIEEGVEWFLISGQLGVELWAAEVVIKLKQTHPHIQLAVLTPFLEQESQWQEASRKKYHDILEAADFVDSITKRPYEGPAQLRLKNEYLVQKSDGLLVLYDEDKPGSSSYYLEVAKKRQQQEPYDIRLITPHDLEWIAQEDEMNDSVDIDNL